MEHLLLTIVSIKGEVGYLILLTKILVQIFLNNWVYPETPLKASTSTND